MGGQSLGITTSPHQNRETRTSQSFTLERMSAAYAKVNQKDGISARTFEFLIGTAARSGEVKFATWDEINFEEALWTIPADRMKAHKIHRVPLTTTLIELLKKLPRFNDNNYIFTAPRGGALSDMDIASVCKRMEIDATPHGFRSSFKDSTRNMTTYTDEVSELALVYVSTDATRAAYARDELLEQRAKLLNGWSSYLYN